jgi:hypothetical protein
MSLVLDSSATLAWIFRSPALIPRSRSSATLAHSLSARYHVRRAIPEVPLFLRGPALQSLPVDSAQTALVIFTPLAERHTDSLHEQATMAEAISLAQELNDKPGIVRCSSPLDLAYSAIPDF